MCPGLRRACQFSVPSAAAQDAATCARADSRDAGTGDAVIVRKVGALESIERRDWGQHPHTYQLCSREWLRSQTSSGLRPSQQECWRTGSGKRGRSCGPLSPRLLPHKAPLSPQGTTCAHVTHRHSVSNCCILQWERGADVQSGERVPWLPNSLRLAPEAIMLRGAVERGAEPPL